MKLNNKGFALTSIIYMLIVLFLMILLLILANLAQRKAVLDKIKNDIKTNLNQGGLIAKNTYTVTFDPTIGQINQTSKQVTYNEPYGELPTPTREGYRFMGWRGKNLFTGLVKGVAINTTTGEAGPNGVNAASDYIEINTDSNNYFLSGLSSDLWSYVSFYNENKEYMGRTSGTSRNSIGIQSTSIAQPASPSVEGNIRYIRIAQYANSVYSTGTIDDIDNLQIQLEPGDTATSYEPYQEYTSDTIVTKRENHTLYAMWEPLYTVTFDPDGGTLSQTSKEVSYHEPYGELPIPTRNGYTFLGWNGKNLFNKETTPETQNKYIRGDGQTVAHNEYSIYQVNINPNTTYTITNSGKSTAPGYVIYDSSGTRLDGANYANTATITFTTPATASYIKFSVVTKTTSTRYDKETFQLEPGSTATEYEPYYITPSTTVVQKNNHTLKAIWEPNE